MSWPLVFHRKVQSEVEDARRWYEQQRSGLGDDFMAALDEVFARLQQIPQAHQVIYRDIRRALPRRFPYSVYYRVHIDRVEIVAVQHSRRDPGRWQSRA